MLQIKLLPKEQLENKGQDILKPKIKTKKNYQKVNI